MADHPGAATRSGNHQDAPPLRRSIFAPPSPMRSLPALPPVALVHPEHSRCAAGNTRACISRPYGSQCFRQHSAILPAARTRRPLADPFARAAWTPTRGQSAMNRPDSPLLAGLRSLHPPPYARALAPNRTQTTRGSGSASARARGNVCGTLVELDSSRGPSLHLQLRGGGLSAGAGVAQPYLSGLALATRTMPRLSHAWIHPSFRSTAESILPRPQWLMEAPLGGESEKMYIRLPHLALLNPQAPVATAALARITVGRPGVWVHLAIVARRWSPREAGSQQVFTPAAPVQSGPFGTEVWDSEHRCWSTVVRWTWCTSSFAAASRVVSKQHVTIFTTPDPARMLVRDLGSTAGTFACEKDASNLLPLGSDQPAVWMDPADTLIYLGKPRYTPGPSTAHSGVKAQVRWIPARESVTSKEAERSDTAAATTESNEVPHPVIDLTHSSPTSPAPSIHPGPKPPPTLAMDEDPDRTLLDSSCDALGQPKHDLDEAGNLDEAADCTLVGCSGDALGKRKRDASEEGKMVRDLSSGGEESGKPASLAPRKKKPRSMRAERARDWLAGGLLGALATFTGLAALGAHWNE